MNKGRSNNSLCEKSMKMVSNIVKLSSFSIAKMSLGTAEPPPAPKVLATLTGSVKAVNDPALPQFPVNLRSQEPHSSSKPISYLIEPTEGHGSRRVIHEEQSIDGKASDYIRKVHAKNRYGSDETSYVLPPPPHVLI